MIPADVAAWIRTHVLTPGYLASTTDPTRCHCQGGPTGHCTADHHDRCPRTQGWHRHGQAEPLTYIASRSHTALTPVWPTGRPCRWLCPCTCHTTVMPLFAAPAAQTRRRSVEMSITATDRALAARTHQPSLLDALTPTA